MRRHLRLLAFIPVAVAGCAQSDTATSPSHAGPQFNVGSSAGVGAVYTMTNAAAGNDVLVFRRASDGTLAADGSVATGGNGTGSGLGNQGGVVLSRDGKWLLVVNAGSNSVSVFARAADGGLTLTDTEVSRGIRPISLTIDGSIVYVLNSSGGGNIAGFRLTREGALTFIGGSIQPLSQPNPDPAQIQFVRDRILAVTEKATNRIVVYRLDSAGAAGPPVANASSGMTPFGFAAFGDRIVVSNAAGGAPGASTLSSYHVNTNGTLTVLSAQIPDFQTAACWVVITRNGRFAYTTNTGSNNTSGYAVHGPGGLSLLHSNGVTATNSGGPVDAAFSSGTPQFLYILNSSGAIDAFRVAANGSLSAIGVTALPAGANGLAAE